MFFAKTLLFLSLFMIFYVYLGYPFLLIVIGRIRKQSVNKADCEPTVTVLIAAYNEELEIEKTLKNKLDLNYPKDKLEIIVVSDGSVDKTEEIVKQFNSQGVKLIRQETAVR